MNVVLISTYELGRQPFGLASPAAWLREYGHHVTQLDLSRQRLDEAAVRHADLVAFYLPMHTATRLALPVIARVRALQPGVQLCAYGLYAPLNADLLRAAGVTTFIGGEFEDELLKLVHGENRRGDIVFLDRLKFRTPDRAGLPPAKEYAQLRLPDGSLRNVGYTEASRGCKHLCRHCPVVNVYNGVFRVVPRGVVLADVAAQVAGGVGHITFGDPDFFNGPAHAMEIVRALHREFPRLSYDVTIKIEHLLQHAELLAELRATGCAFVTSAVESLDNTVLARLEKHHTRADFLHVLEQMRRAELPLSPTFIPFTPWTTLASYADLLRTLAELGLVEHVAPVQLAIRLLIPEGSRLLQLDEVRAVIGPFDREKLAYPWRHPDPRVDELQRQVEGVVALIAKHDTPREQVFSAVSEVVKESAPQLGWKTAPLAARATIPYLTEPWYC